MVSLQLPDLVSHTPRLPAARRPGRVAFCAGEHAQVHAILRRLFGRRLAPAQLAALAGAPPDAHLEIGVYHRGLYLDCSDPPRYRYRGVVRLVPRHGRPVLVIDALHVHQPALRGRGLGLAIFSRQLAAADELNLPRIETHAGRRADENGYYTWPRYGFAGTLPRLLRRRLPPHLAGHRDVLDLMRSEAGRAWWRRHGVPMHLAFDLTYNSPSRQAFSQYRAKRRATAYHGTRHHQ